MLKLHVHNETSRLRAVVLGIAKSNGPMPTAEECYDPKSLENVIKGTYPIEKDMIEELSGVAKVFEKYGVTVFRPDIIKDCNQIFVRDIAFVIGDYLIESNIIPLRKKELLALDFLRKEILAYKRIKLPEACHVEGGDVVLFNDYIFMGVYAGDDYSDIITARTNMEAVEAIKQLFPHKKVKAFELRKSNTNPKDNALHLDCCFNVVGYDKVILHKESFLNEDDYDWIVKFFGKAQIFEITTEEMSEMTNNVFSISEDIIISDAFFTRLNEWLRLQGFKVEEVNYREISKQGGLFRCTTLPLIRD